MKNLEEEIAKRILHKFKFIGQLPLNSLLLKCSANENKTAARSQDPSDERTQTFQN